MENIWAYIMAEQWRLVKLAVHSPIAEAHVTLCLSVFIGVKVTFASADFTHVAPRGPAGKICSLQFHQRAGNFWSRNLGGQNLIRSAPSPALTSCRA